MAKKRKAGRPRVPRTIGQLLESMQDIYEKAEVRAGGVILPKGVYPARLTTFASEVRQTDDGTPFGSFRVGFTVTEGAYDGQEAFMFYNTLAKEGNRGKFYPGISGLKTMAAALAGEPPETLAEAADLIEAATVDNPQAVTLRSAPRKTENAEFQNLQITSVDSDDEPTEASDESLGELEPEEAPEEEDVGEGEADEFSFDEDEDEDEEEEEEE